MSVGDYERFWKVPNMTNNRLKTLVVIDSMSVGGIATSLYNFLKYTDERLACDLLVFDPDSVDVSRLPEGVQLLPHAKELQMLGVCQRDYQKKKPLLALYRAGLVLCAKVISGEFARRILFATSKKIRNYDLAISFAHDNGWKVLSKGCIDFVVDKVEAVCKVGFIHCDYSNYGGYDPRQEKKLSKLDAIACVSDSCTERFASVFPNLRSQCITCENFADVEAVCQKSEPAVSYPADKVNFVTVCRLGEEKGLLRTVEVFAELYRDGHQNFTWTIVGGGPEEACLREAVVANGLEGLIIFAGERRNPYPYIKNASVFLLPSIHEAAPMVFGESIVLNVPILTTNTCSAVELVKDRNVGIVVDNSQEGIKAGVQKILDDPSVLDEIIISADQINKHANQQVDAMVALARATFGDFK